MSYNQIVRRALSSGGSVENSLGVRHLLQWFRGGNVRPVPWGQRDKEERMEGFKEHVGGAWMGMGDIYSDRFVISGAMWIG